MALEIPLEWRSYESLRAERVCAVCRVPGCKNLVKYAPCVRSCCCRPFRLAGILTVFREIYTFPHFRPTLTPRIVQEYHFAAFATTVSSYSAVLFGCVVSSWLLIMFSSFTVLCLVDVAQSGKAWWWVPISHHYSYPATRIHRSTLTPTNSCRRLHDLRWSVRSKRPPTDPSKIKEFMTLEVALTSHYDYDYILFSWFCVLCMIAFSIVWFNELYRDDRCMRF